jgi:hypothetical protein
MLVISPFLPVFISKETTKEFIFLKINFRIAYLVSNYRSQLAEIPVVSLIFAGQLRFFPSFLMVKSQFSSIFVAEIPVSSLIFLVNRGQKPCGDSTWTTRQGEIFGDFPWEKMGRIHQHGENPGKLLGSDWKIIQCGAPVKDS